VIDRLERHPNLTAWAVLAVGMLIILAWSARDVGLNARQWLALAAATVALAGLCAWIISWEADDDAAEGDMATEGATGDTSGAAGVDDRASADTDATGDGRGTRDAPPAGTNDGGNREPA